MWCGARLAGLALLTGACGRLAFEARGDGTVDEAVSDSGSILPGESVTLAPGWTADVWFDFSAAFTYDPNFYVDTPNTFTNRPHRIFVMPPPFAPGIGLVSTGSVFELRSPDVFVEHSYHQSLGASGPDALWKAVDCADWMAVAAGELGLCVVSGSQNAGDGIFRIEGDWSLRLIDPINNACDVVFDRAGAFDQLGTPTLYFGGPTTLRRYNDLNVFSGDFNGATTELLPTNDLLTVLGGTAGPWQLVRIASTSHAGSVLANSAVSPGITRQMPGAFAIVAGDIAALPGSGYVIVDAARLVELDSTGGQTVIAETLPQDGWLWTHAVVAPPTYALGGGRSVFYLLEVHPATETNRVVRLVAP